MKILEYEFSQSNWKINRVGFQQVNLIVGDSGSGKTRLLNTIFNLGRSVVHHSIVNQDTDWYVRASVGDREYKWEVSIEKQRDQGVVKSERLYVDNDLVLKRDQDSFEFKGNAQLKLPRNEMSISILREEELVKPLYDGFSTILRRKFFSSDLGESASLYAISQRSLNEIGKKLDLFQLYKADLGLNPRLYVLKTFFPDIYSHIVELFMDTFQFVSKVEILDAPEVDVQNAPSQSPVFCIRESGTDQWERLDELSSGMQKALLILTDLLALPKSCIYLIDEYENSLGVTPINVLPNLLLSESVELQIFVTSHHPYIISKFPVENWYVAHRKGPVVNFMYGKELAERYGASSQEKYIQLLNDPFFAEGIE